MRKEVGPNGSQYTALHDDSVVETTDEQVNRVVIAARFMQRVLAAGAGRRTDSSSPDVPLDVQTEPTTSPAARLHADNCIQVSFMM